MHSPHATRGQHLGFSRRKLLQAGGQGVLGLGLPGLGLPELLARRAQAEGRVASRVHSCIFVVQYGGASHIDTLDPKPGAPDEIRGPYKPIATPAPGVHLSEMLPQLAQLADRYCLIRSMTHGNSGHDGGMHVCMTGHSNPTRTTPYFGSLVARYRPSERNIPSYVWLQNLAGDVQPWYLDGGVLGAAYGPMLVGKDEANPSQADFRVREFDPAAGQSPERLLGQAELLRRIEPQGRPRLEADGPWSFRRFQERAVELVTSAEARAAFDLNREPEPVRDRYGRHPFGQNLLMARRLVEAGVRLVTVNAWCGRASTDDVLATQGWDHHGAEVQRCGIFDTGTFSLGFVLPRFDQALSALLADLESRGLLESTLVVCVGEFGRTPKISQNPFVGRDHWPQCYSALLAGGGIRGGAVYGSSDAQGAYVKSYPVSPEDFGATIFQALGIPPETRYGPDGFSLRVSDGQPVDELFG